MEEQDAGLISVAEKMIAKSKVCESIAYLIKRALSDVEYYKSEVKYNDMCEAIACATKLKEKAEDIARMGNAYIIKQGEILQARIKAKILAETGDEDEAIEEDTTGGEGQDDTLLN